MRDRGRVSRVTDHGRVSCVTDRGRVSRVTDGFSSLGFEPCARDGVDLPSEQLIGLADGWPQLFRNYTETREN